MLRPRRILVTSVLLTAVMLLGVSRGLTGAWLAGAADDTHACCPEQLKQAEAPSPSPATLPKCCFLTSGSGTPVSTVPAATQTGPAPPAQYVSATWAAAVERTIPMAQLPARSRLPIPLLQRTSVLLI